uniref:ComE n=1 Tax=Streptomyces citricolor TaxID=212427 RepID=A0A7R6FIF6_9ACTN|nr:ComE [Streptomyces citricolor]
MTSILERLQDHTLADLAVLDVPADTSHLSRTAELAGRIADESGLTSRTARLAVYLYHRFRVPGTRDHPAASTRAAALDLLTRSGVPEELHQELLTVVGPGTPSAGAPYGAAVLDAERLDAMGAAGLQRALTGAGSPWHPDEPADGSPRPTPPELYEALVRSERELLTEAARRLAADRMDLVHRFAADYRTEAELGRLPDVPGRSPAAVPGVSWDLKAGFLRAVAHAPGTGPLVRIGYRGTVWLTFDDQDRLLGIDLRDAPPALVAILPHAQQYRFYWHSTARGSGMAWWADHGSNHVWITTAPGPAHHRVVATADIEVGTRADRPVVLHLHVRSGR